jgi:DNA-binding MarR family transcriptional regulator
MKMLETAQKLDMLAAEAEAYVQSSFGIRLDLVPVRPASLPHFLLDRYRFWQGSLLGQPMLLAAGRNWRPGMGFTADFVKHRDLLRRQLGVQFVLLLLDHVPATVRRQMVERKIGFLSPGSQLYVPDALLDLRERGTRAPAEPSEQITPTAQLLLLAVLLGEQLDDSNLTELAERFQVAVMSMSRALDELEALQIAKARHVGRQRRLHLLLQGRELWDSVRDRLHSPVRKVRTVRGAVDGGFAPRAGESALAHYTMLAAPRVERRAIAALRWKEVAQKVENVGEYVFEEDRTELETWSYDPLALAREGVVDPLSLYLSVRHNPDERVTQAAEQLLEPFGW